MPTLRRIGISTGTRMLIEAIGSRKQPTTSSSTLISNRMMYLLSVRFSSASAPASVSGVVVSTHPNSEAAATIKSKPAEGHAADDDRGRQQGGHRRDKGAAERDPAKRLIGAHTVAPRAIAHIEHHEDGHHGARNEAAEKQRADRDIPHHAVDHKR